jgi:hypothetical protein
MAERCQAQARSGKPCSALAVDGIHCPWHSAAPEWVEKRRQWSAKGGERRSNAARAKKALPTEPMAATEVHAWLSLAFKKTLAGSMEPGILNALANAARTMAELSKAAEIEGRLVALEQQQAQLRGRAS